MTLADALMAEFARDMQPPPKPVRIITHRDPEWAEQNREAWHTLDRNEAARRKMMMEQANA